MEKQEILKNPKIKNIGMNHIQFIPENHKYWNESHSFIPENHKYWNESHSFIHSIYSIETLLIYTLTKTIN